MSVTPEFRQKMRVVMTGRMREDCNAWRGDSASYMAIHSDLRRRFPKTGRCEHCHSVPPPVVYLRKGREIRRAGTDYAFLHHPSSPTRDRADYIELCRACHKRMDAA